MLRKQAPVIAVALTALLLLGGVTAGVALVDSKSSGGRPSSSQAPSPAEKQLLNEAKGMTPRQRITLFGTALCGYLDVSKASKIYASCKATQLDASNSKKPALWQLSQVVASGLDVGLGSHSPAWLRRAYASALYDGFALYGYRPCHENAFCTGLSPYGGTNAPEYHDDNAWVGLDLMQSYHQSLDRRLLRAAESIYSFEYAGVWIPADRAGGYPVPQAAVYPYKVDLSGVPTSATYFQDVRDRIVPPHPADSQAGTFNGMFWSTERVNRGIAANADAAEFAFDLYQVDHDSAKLRFAEDEYTWVQTVLQKRNATSATTVPRQTQTTGLFYDHITPDGLLQGTAQPESEGLMIGLAINLARTESRDFARYKADAIQMATATNAWLVKRGPQKVCAAFNAVYYHYLWQLDQFTGRNFTSGSTQYLKWLTEETNASGQFVPAALETAADPGDCSGALPQSGDSRFLIDSVTHR